MELAYVDAALAKAGSGASEQWSASDWTQKSMSDSQAMDVLRKSLGHPLDHAKTVRCIVTGVHGMDAACAPERLLVASRLWAEGISAEYIPQSGVMISLLKRHGESLESMGDRSAVSLKGGSAVSETGCSHSSFSVPFLQDWSLDELFGVCAILRIPFVVIVQPHLLRDKGSVRLRRISFDTPSGSTGGNEIFCSLENLASTVASGMDEDAEPPERSTPNESESTQKVSSAVECIYVDTDQYYGLDKQVSKSDTSNYKAILKSIKGVTQRSEAYLNDLQMTSPAQGTPVFAVNLPFWELRDFGTSLMKHGEPSAVTELYPIHKKVFKTLAMAIDSVLKKYGKSSVVSQVTILLYSKVDDRFDMVTLNSHQRGSIEPNGDSFRRKSERR